MQFEIPEDFTDDRLADIQAANEVGLERVATYSAQKMQAGMLDAPNIVKGEGGWKRPKGIDPIHSTPGNPPFKQTGRLKRAIISGKVAPGQWAAGTAAGYDPDGHPYGFYLDKGTTKMSPRPWLGSTVEKYRDKLIEAYRRGFIHAMKWDQ